MYLESNATSCLVTDRSECQEPPLASRQQTHCNCQIVISIKRFRQKITLLSEYISDACYIYVRYSLSFIMNSWCYIRYMYMLYTCRSVSAIWDKCHLWRRDRCATVCDTHTSDDHCYTGGLHQNKRKRKIIRHKYALTLITVYAWSEAVATKCFILMEEEATIRERPLFKSGV